MPEVKIKSSVGEGGMMRLFHDGELLPAGDEVTVDVVRLQKFAENQVSS